MFGILPLMGMLSTFSAGTSMRRAAADTESGVLPKIIRDDIASSFSTFNILA